MYGRARTGGRKSDRPSSRRSVRRSCHHMTAPCAAPSLSCSGRHRNAQPDIEHRRNPMLWHRLHWRRRIIVNKGLTVAKDPGMIFLRLFWAESIYLRNFTELSTGLAQKYCTLGYSDRSARVSFVPRVWMLYEGDALWRWALHSGLHRQAGDID